MPARHVSNTDKVVDHTAEPIQHRQLELYALRRVQPVKASEHLSDVV